MSPPRVLVIADYFLPGFRAGGPIRAIANTMTRLSSDVSFAVVSRDHDTDGVPYRDVRSGQWNGDSGTVGGAVYYAPRFTWGVLRRCIDESASDAIWLNSFFSRATLRVLLLRRLGRIRQPILLAPRGELSRGALSLKPGRKRIGIQALLGSRCLRDIHWLAASPLEADDIRSVVGAVPVTIVPESVSEPPVPIAGPAKEPGALRIVFASRIDAMKNLKFLLDVVAHARGRLHLDIIGPIDNRSYWRECRIAIDGLPVNVTVDYVGELPHQELRGRLQAYDLLALPSLGENFGHIVVEAWAAGCPVLVSDRTPWRGLAEDGAGWDLPLERARWVSALEACLDMPAGVHATLRRRAAARARRAWQDGAGGVEAFRRLVFSVVRNDGSDSYGVGAGFVWPSPGPPDEGRHNPCA